MAAPPFEATSSQPGVTRQYESQERADPSSYLGLNYGVSPRTTPRSVSIAPGAEIMSPLMLGKQKMIEEEPLEHGRVVRKPSVRSARDHRLLLRHPSHSPAILAQSPASGLTDTHIDQSILSYYSTAQVDSLLAQIAAWIAAERSKRSLARRLTDRNLPPAVRDQLTPSNSDDPDLDRLEQILHQNLTTVQLPARTSSTPLRSRASHRRLQRHASSASVSSADEYFGGELEVPACDVVLDNSKTLAYADNVTDDSDDYSSDDELTRTPSYRDQTAWASFKFEILRLAHTLHLKRWRRVPLELSTSISVQRLSGALTNAVYVVTPPGDISSTPYDTPGNPPPRKSRKAPPKLLLRIYGPNVEHLIDRSAELAMLRRLARQHIGPRLLGTFANGRFEQYFHAVPLTPKDLRNPETSRHIAKRMRELHDGIELLEDERAAGAFVWRNWDRWLSRVERVVCWLDTQIELHNPIVPPKGLDAWRKRGYVCGLPWQRFREAVEKYRTWLYEQYGGIEAVNDRLVFAHNDTQCGNILRLLPPGDSPLLLPENSHKQLIVIDFEYANANLPGLEFANHFTEWCYNYHHKRRPYAIHLKQYPTPEEQERFVRAYVRHKREYHIMTPSASPETPFKLPSRSTASNLQEFMLDARTPYQPITTLSASVDDGAAEKEAEDLEVKRLMHETRLWRLANTAQWVAWGIVQARVPGLSLDEEQSEAGTVSGGSDEQGVTSDAAVTEVEPNEHQAAEETEEFDYLGYAHHRAMFFWGDALQLGIVKEEDLPEDMRKKVKTVPY